MDQETWRTVIASVTSLVVGLVASPFGKNWLEGKRAKRAKEEGDLNRKRDLIRDAQKGVADLTVIRQGSAYVVTKGINPVCAQEWFVRLQSELSPELVKVLCRSGSAWAVSDARNTNLNKLADEIAAVSKRWGVDH